MNKKQIALTLGGVCLVLTAAIVIQINTIKKTIQVTDPTFAENGLRDEVLRWKEKYDNAYSDLEKAQKELEKERTKATQNNDSSAQKEEEIKKNNAMVGLAEVTGKGVTITLKDNQSVSNDSIGALDDINQYVVHDTDLLSVINELKNAGAEAICLNEQRLIPTSSVTCAGNVAQINGQKVGAPFAIKAVGIPESLYDALARPGGYLELLKSYGITADIKKSNNLTIPKYSGVITYQYLKEVK